MKKYFLALAVALALLSVKGQNVSQLAQTEKDEYANIRFIKPAAPVEFNKENEFFLINSLLSTGTRKELSFKLNNTLTEDGYTHNTYKFAYEGIPVSGVGFSTHIKGNQILFANGLIPVIEKWLSTKPILLEKDAIEKAGSYFTTNNQLNKLTKPLHTANKGLEFVYKNNAATLCYKIEIGRSRSWAEELVYVSAINGEIIKALPTVCRSHGLANNKSTEIFNKKTKSSTNIPPYVAGTGASIYSGNVPIKTDSWNGGYRLRDLRNNTNILTLNANNENIENIDVLIQNASDFFDNNNNWTAAEHPNDKQAVDVHWALTQTYEYFYQVHNRSSYNNNGADIKGYVHTAFPSDQNKNAYWIGEPKNIMVYGDGYLDIPPFTTLDICSHELAHGLTQTTANLESVGVEGALNEGFSDIWASTVENYAAPGKQKWIFGDELGIYAGYLKRNLASPLSTSNPDSYGGTNWVNTNGCTPTNNNDACGVHKNCTVLGHWYYLLVEGGNGWNNGQTSHAPTGQGYSWSVNSIGWLNAAKIVLLTEQLINNSPADWQLTRTLSIQAAQQLFGSGSCEEAAVVAAWRAVGLGNYPVYNINGPEILCRNTVNTYSLEQTPPTGTTVNWTITPNDGNVILTPNGNAVDVDASNASNTIWYTLNVAVTGSCYSGSGSRQLGNVPTEPWSGSVWGASGWYNGVYSGALVEGDNYLYTGTGANYFEITVEGNNEVPNTGFWSYVSGDYRSYGGPHFIAYDLWWLNGVDSYYDYYFTNACGSHVIHYHFITSSSNPPNYRMQQQPKESYKLLVTPNPANTYAYLAIQESEPNKISGSIQFDYSKPVNIKVYDKMGKLLLQQNSIIPKTGLRLNVAMLKPTDIYNIIVDNDKGMRLSAKLMKQ